MYYIHSPGLDPFMHFALEYYLMQEKTDDYLMLWRTEPTLMVGRYQNTLEEIDAGYARQQGLHIVRRITGGGAIYTDPGTWQFGFIRSRHADEPLDFGPYIRPALAALSSLGVDAAFSGRNDIVADGRKLSGNAQHLSARRMVHHGSILFDADFDTMVRALSPRADKITSKGVKSVRARVVNVRSLLARDMDAEAFGHVLRTHLSGALAGEMTLSETEWARVRAIAEEKFRSFDWNFGASPRFDMVKSRRFPGGLLEIAISAEAGCITACEIRGDFFARTDVGAVSAALIGRRLEEADVRAALADAGADAALHGVTAQDILSCLFHGGA